jgi:hypothetical protein
LVVLLVGRRISIWLGILRRIQVHTNNNKSGSGRPETYESNGSGDQKLMNPTDPGGQKLMNPTDPDLEHC